MAFILTVLKLIGIVLAVIIALIVLIIAAVLIMPFGYEFSGEKYEKIKASAAVKWLFGIVRVELNYNEEELQYSLKVFGKTLYPKEEKPVEVKVRGAAKTEAPKEAKPVEKTVVKPVQEPKKEPAKTKPAEVKKEPVKKTVEKPEPKAEAMAKEDDKPKVIRVKMPEVSDFAEEEKEPEKMTLKGFIIGYIKEMTADDRKKAVLAVLNLIKGMLKHVLPGDISVYAVVGTDDPSVTGFILALSGILRGATGKDILVQGDFEKKRAEGEAFVKGRIRLGSMLYMVTRLLLTRPIRKFIIRFIKVRGELV